jgi:glucose-specific phosphotransferase system IIA component
MSLVRRIFRKKKNNHILLDADPMLVYAPIQGQFVPLEEIDDDAFSAGYLGKGCGINPTAESIVAPFEGEVVQVAPTRHAVGLRSKNGIEVLIHIGLDTVKMKGSGFDVEVKPGDQVKYGQLLIGFSIAAIKKAGFQPIVAVTVTNSEKYQDISIIEKNQIRYCMPLFRIS